MIRRAVFLLRDSDNQPERAAGLRQARETASQPFAVVIGVAHPMRECWVIAAFQPAGDGDQKKLGGLRRVLGFDPCVHSHRLTARKASAKRNPKRVFALLCDGEPSREAEILMAAPFESLRQRGAKNGLKAYLEEIEQQLVPLFR